MQFMIRQSTTIFRYLHIILFTTILLVGPTIQADVSGYICDDLVVSHDEAVKVAQLASELVKSVDVRYKFPALLEDTQLFGIEGENLFVVPFRRFGSLRSGGHKGRDRVVIDAYGKFIGVIYDTNDANVNPLPAYRKCRPFLDDNHLELEKYIDDGYQLAGFACGSNFLDRDVETNMHNKCVEYLNSPPEIQIKFKFSRNRCVSRGNNELWFRYDTDKNYDNKQTKAPNSFKVKFNTLCTFLNIEQISKINSNQKPCLHTWTAIPPAEATMTDSLFDTQSTNYLTSNEFYACKNHVFRISSIQNYIFRIFSLLIDNSLPNIERMMQRQDDKLILWPMPLPERHVPSLKYPLAFSIGFDDSNQFSGIYVVRSHDWARLKAKPCPNFNLLKSRLSGGGSA